MWVRRVHSPPPPTPQCSQAHGGIGSLPLRHGLAPHSRPALLVRACPGAVTSVLACRGPARHGRVSPHRSSVCVLHARPGQAGRRGVLRSQCDDGCEMCAWSRSPHRDCEQLADRLRRLSAYPGCTPGRTVLRGALAAWHAHADNLEQLAHRVLAAQAQLRLTQVLPEALARCAPRGVEEQEHNSVAQMGR